MGLWAGKAQSADSPALPNLQLSSDLSFPIHFVHTELAREVWRQWIDVVVQRLCRILERDGCIKKGVDSFWNYIGTCVLCGGAHPYLWWMYWWYAHTQSIKRPESSSRLICSKTRHQTGFWKGYIETAENLLETWEKTGISTKRICFPWVISAFHQTLII